MILGGGACISCAGDDVLEVSDELTDLPTENEREFLSCSGVLLLSLRILSSSEDESVTRFRSREVGEVAITDVRFEGIGIEGLGF